MDSIFLAILRELLRRYPGLTLATILAQIQGLADDVKKAVVAQIEEGLRNDRGWPGWPRIEVDESGTPTGYYWDDEGVKRHYRQDTE